MRILIVEDEPIIALNLHAMVLDLGHRPIGHAENIAGTLELATQRRVEAAIVDISRLDGEGLALAEALAGQDIPVLFSTARSPGALDGLPAGSAVLYKPYLAAELEAALTSLAETAEDRRVYAEGLARQKGSVSFAPPSAPLDDPDVP